MNCRTIEPLLFAERDGVLTAAQHASLAEHLATCTACRQTQAHLAAAMSAIRSDTANVAVPDVDEEWRTLHSRISRDSTGAKKKKTLAPVLWFGAPLAAAAAVAFAFYISPTPATTGGAAMPAEIASAEYVEAGDAEASTMVYVDKESGWLVVWATDAKDQASG